MKEKPVAEYDKFDYDYTQFWKTRSYENAAETYALNRVFKNLSGNLFVDLGGSFGRHTEIYHQKYHNCILCDYSIKALKQARESFKKSGISNVHLVAANIHSLPFKDNVFDGIMMIRVLHHLDQEAAINEVSRIAQTESTFILEFPNKVNIKSVIQNILRFNYKYLFSLEPSSIPTTSKAEGTDKTEPGIIKRYNPRLIKKLLYNASFKITRRISLSFFRIGLLKKLIPTKILLFFEKAFQLLFSWTLITPSLLFVNKKKTDQNKEPKNIEFSIEEILCCPKCKGEIQHKQDKYICENCSELFPLVGKIIDLRYPKPSK